MYIHPRHIVTLLQAITWIIFIGVSIEAGGFIFSTVYALYFNPGSAEKMWNGANMAELLAHDRGWFAVLGFLSALVAMLRATLFYIIIRMLANKKLDLANPFNPAIARVIIFCGHLALVISFFSSLGIKYGASLAEKGISVPSAETMRVGGADVWFFMAVVLYVFAAIFKKGIQIQTENELTV